MSESRTSWPHSTEAEESIIGGVLLHPVVFPNIDVHLHPDDFHHPALRVVYEAMKALDAAGKPIDVLTVEQQLKADDQLDKLRAIGGGIDALVELQSKVFSVENLTYYAQLVAKKAVRRRIIQGASEIAAKGFSASDDDGFLEEAEKLMLEMAMQRRNDELPRTMGQALKAFVKDLQERYERRQKGMMLAGWTSGLDDFDEATAGFEPGDLVIVAGRPGMGKSAFLGTCLKAAAEAQKEYHPPVQCLWFSLEMPNTQNVRRLVSSKARVDGNRLRKADLDQRLWTLVVKASSDLEPLPIFWEDAHGLTLSKIRSISRRWRMTVAKPLPVPPPKEGEKPKKPEPRPAMIGIDYAQLIDPEKVAKKNSTRDQEIGIITRGLKQLAKELHLPIILLSQLNRGLENREDHRPRMSDLRESGSLEQDADMIVFLYRDEVYNKPSESDDAETAARKKEKEGVTELIIAKQRNGDTGTVEVLFEKAYTHFKNLSKRSSFDGPPRDRFGNDA